MIESLVLFSKTGSVLYTYKATTTKVAAASNKANNADKKLQENLNQLIHDYLLENRAAQEKSCVLHQKNKPGAGLVAEWEELNDRNWVAVAFYKEVLKGLKHMNFVRTLLKGCIKEFIIFYDRLLAEASTKTYHVPLPEEDLPKFDATFEALLRLCERNKIGKENGVTPPQDVTAGKDSDIKATTNGKKKKTGKQKTVWHGTGKVSKEAMEKLDQSKDKGSSAADADDSRALMEARATYLPSEGESATSWIDGEDDDLDDNCTDSESSSSWGGSLKGLFDQMSGNKVLTESDVSAALEGMEQTLVSKNVAQNIAKEICNGVKAKVVGKKLASFGRVKSTVRAALESSIARILIPQRSIDVLREVKAKQSKWISRQSRPYVIVMVGINGVGKSTSLAKIAYYLKSNGCNPLLAACDTFRSGAVEQLGVHAKCLDVPLFAKGYAKDPSAVAKEAIQVATEQRNDVVLVDTAGRMQNNVPLMNALSKLVVENNPDLVCFVGEALVGNDGIDQLQMFDQALRNGGHGRRIDGIILTKFDTVSDKVGAALSMTHITGQPVLFVGTGQKYNHLKKLSVPAVIKSLFS